MEKWPVLSTEPKVQQRAEFTMRKCVFGKPVFGSPPRRFAAGRAPYSPNDDLIKNVATQKDWLCRQANYAQHAPYAKPLIISPQPMFGKLQGRHAFFRDRRGLARPTGRPGRSSHRKHHVRFSLAIPKQGLRSWTLSPRTERSFGYMNPNRNPNGPPPVCWACYTVKIVGVGSYAEARSFLHQAPTRLLRRPPRCQEPGKSSGR